LEKSTVPDERPIKDSTVSSEKMTGGMPGAAAIKEGGATQAEGGRLTLSDRPRLAGLLNGLP
jgi:hypothetical protein